jgi:flavin reductase (DIM6/NTAB) family NADH-FMN oxidoreductase RutF
MKLIKKILNKLNGLYYPQEYLCLAKESFHQPLHTYLADGSRIIKDITKEHLFTGYSPLIFTLYSPDKKKQELPAAIDIIFTQQSLQPNDHFEKKDAIAHLSLKMIRKQLPGGIPIIYYEGVKGEHHFLSSFHQYMIGLNNRLYNKKAGNVFLHDNLYKQVQIAYSIPRIISLITVSDGGLYNLFPTDLHGPVNEQYYVCSLRHEGKASRQVEAAGRIVISQMHYDAYKIVYSLGKSHTQELKPKSDLPFGESVSKLFQLPLPEPVLYYRELELIESFDHGIHKLLLFKVLSTQAISHEPATLAHIHNVYATWRYNKGLSGNYLLR